MDHKEKIRSIEVELDSVEEFLDYLNPYKSHWGERKLGRYPKNFGWIFRGQGDSDWALTPPSQRLPEEGLNKSFHPSIYRRKFDKSALGEDNRAKHVTTEITTIETILVNDFIDISDSIGINVSYLKSSHIIKYFDSIYRKLGRLGKNFGPEYHALYKTPDTNIKSPLIDIYNDFPPPELYDLFSLAQHYSIPTRFLDWTFSPFVAAFFAAHDVAEGNIKSEKISVWSVKYLEAHPVRANRNINLIFANNSVNPFLRSQRGAFTLVPASNSRFYDLGRWIPHDEVMLNGLPKEWQDYSSIIKKIILPSELAEELLISLSRLGVNYITIYPSLKNISEHMKIERRLRSSENDNWINRYFNPPYS
ncbi:MAG: FRG domain-containing protein [Bacteroidetes bacterium]|nr:FRG domain-containing protein [Bacteroidota bacterium]